MSRSTPRQAAAATGSGMLAVIALLVGRASLAPAAVPVADQSRLAVPPPVAGRPVTPDLSSPPTRTPATTTPPATPPGSDPPATPPGAAGTATPAALPPRSGAPPAAPAAASGAPASGGPPPTGQPPPVGASTPASPPSPTPGSPAPGPPAPPPPSGGPSAVPTPAADRTVDGAAVTTRYGVVQVALVLAGTRIVDVRSLQLPSGSAHTNAVSANAPQRLRLEVLAGQSAAVAAVSGATYTSTGYLASVQSALDAAR